VPGQVEHAGGSSCQGALAGPYRCRTLYALSQGVFPAGNPPGAPALPNTGTLVQANEDGTFDVIANGINQPTSLEFIGNTAYVVTLTGEIWRIDGVSDPPYGTAR
jgi:hypothetical protein